MPGSGLSSARALAQTVEVGGLAVLVAAGLDLERAGGLELAQAAIDGVDGTPKIAGKCLTGRPAGALGVGVLAEHVQQQPGTRRNRRDQPRPTLG